MVLGQLTSRFTALTNTATSLLGGSAHAGLGAQARPKGGPLSTPPQHPHLTSMASRVLGTAARATGIAGSLFTPTAAFADPGATGTDWQFELIRFSALNPELADFAFGLLAGGLGLAASFAVVGAATIFSVGAYKLADRFLPSDARQRLQLAWKALNGDLAEPPVAVNSSVDMASVIRSRLPIMKLPDDDDDDTEESQPGPSETEVKLNEAVAQIATLTWQLAIRERTINDARRENRRLNRRRATQAAQQTRTQGDFQQATAALISSLELTVQSPNVRFTLKQACELLNHVSNLRAVLYSQNPSYPEDEALTAIENHVIANSPLYALQEAQEFIRNSIDEEDYEYVDEHIQDLTTLLDAIPESYEGLFIVQGIKFTRSHLKDLEHQIAELQKKKTHHTSQERLVETVVPMAPFINDGYSTDNTITFFDETTASTLHPDLDTPTITFGNPQTSDATLDESLQQMTLTYSNGATIIITAPSDLPNGKSKFKVTFEATWPDKPSFQRVGVISTEDTHLINGLITQAFEQWSRFLDEDPAHSADPITLIPTSETGTDDGESLDLGSDDTEDNTYMFDQDSPLSRVGIAGVWHSTPHLLIGTRDNQHLNIGWALGLATTSVGHNTDQNQLTIHLKNGRSLTLNITEESGVLTTSVTDAFEGSQTEVSLGTTENALVELESYLLLLPKDDETNEVLRTAAAPTTRPTEEPDELDLTDDDDFLADDEDMVTDETGPATTETDPGRSRVQPAAREAHLRKRLKGARPAARPIAAVRTTPRPLPQPPRPSTAAGQHPRTAGAPIHQGPPGRVMAPPPPATSTAEPVPTRTREPRDSGIQGRALPGHLQRGGRPADRAASPNPRPARATATRPGRTTRPTRPTTLGFAINGTQATLTNGHRTTAVSPHFEAEVHIDFENPELQRFFKTKPRRKQSARQAASLAEARRTKDGPNLLSETIRLFGIMAKDGAKGSTEPAKPQGSLLSLADLFAGGYWNHPYARAILLQLTLQFVGIQSRIVTGVIRDRTGRIVANGPMIEITPERGKPDTYYSLQEPEPKMHTTKKFAENRIHALETRPAA